MYLLNDVAIITLSLIVWCDLIFWVCSVAFQGLFMQKKFSPSTYLIKKIHWDDMLKIKELNLAIISVIKHAT